MNSNTEWIKSLKKKIKGFLKTCPIDIKVVYLEDRVRLHLNNTSNFVDEFYNYDKPLKDFVYDLKTKLVQYYPTIIIQTRTKKAYDNLKDAIKDLEVNDSIPILEEENTYIFDKVFLQENSVILVDPIKNRTAKYTCKIPLLFLMLRLAKMKGTYDQAWLNEWFAKNFYFVNFISNSNNRKKV